MSPRPVVLAVHDWSTNGHLIADVARLYFPRTGRVVVLDATYGEGVWWTVYRPRHLIAHDLHTLDGVDFTALPEVDGSIDVVAFDPPYKLNGTPTPEVDGRYGLHEYVPWQDKHALIREGITECVRVLRSRGVLLVKCQDQVCSGQVRWQTREFTDHAEAQGVRLVDRFDLLGTAREQPMEYKMRTKDPGAEKKAIQRKQRHAHGRPSTLLVFVKR